MNGTVVPPEAKAEPDELNGISSAALPAMQSPPPTALPTVPIKASVAVRPSASPLDVLPDSSRVTSHSSTPDLISLKSPTADRPSLSPSSTTAPARNPLASLQSAKRKRLPQDKVGQLEDRIALDARDADAWLALIAEHQAKGKISDARNTYERFFKVFPDLVRPRRQ